MNAISIIILTILLIILGPFIILLGLNELLEQGSVDVQFPYNFWTWLSVIIISGTFRSVGVSVK